MKPDLGYQRDGAASPKCMKKTFKKKQVQTYSPQFIQEGHEEPYVPMGITAMGLLHGSDSGNSEICFSVSNHFEKG